MYCRGWPFIFGINIWPQHQHLASTSTIGININTWHQPQRSVSTSTFGLNIWNQQLLSSIIALYHRAQNVFVSCEHFFMVLLLPFCVLLLLPFYWAVQRLRIQNVTNICSQTANKSGAMATGSGIRAYFAFVSTGFTKWTEIFLANNAILNWILSIFLGKIQIQLEK